MLPGDLIITGTGKTQKMYVKSESGKLYRLGKKLGQGGVGRVFFIFDEQDHDKKYVLKEYPVPADSDQRRQQLNIKKNLRSLIEHPVLETDNTPLSSIVPPIEMVFFPKTDSFGYVMNYVPIKENHYLSLVGLRKTNPSADILCEIGLSVSHFFVRLSRSQGACYKDINEGNIYLDPASGDIRVIDNDNVGDPKTRTISGTSFYMAPEVVTGQQDPDRHTDEFQLATYLYRLFVGGAPYEGKSAVQYMLDHELGMLEAAPEVFGKRAVFVFDPNDQSNTIRVNRLAANMTEEQKKTIEIWKAQATLWDRLPPRLQKNFIQTFATPNRDGRVTALKWEETFKELKNEMIVCPACHQKTFGSSSVCFSCGSSKRRTVTCKQCGRATPKELSFCVFCKKDPQKKPDKLIQCPHCGKSNPETAERCATCGKYIRVKCTKCRTVSSGDNKICPKCKSLLFSPCPSPSCKKDNLVNAASCVYCGTKLSNAVWQCGRCGRKNLGWHKQCIECGAPVSGTAPSPAPQPRPQPAPPPSDTKTFLLTIRVGKQASQFRLVHTFGKGVTTYYADHFSPLLPHVPLFEMKFNPQNSAYGIKNKTGMAMKCKTISTGATQDVAPDRTVSWAPGQRLTFGNCVYQGEAFMAILMSIT